MKRLAAALALFAAGVVVGLATSTRRTAVDVLRASGGLSVIVLLGCGSSSTPAPTPAPANPIVSPAPPVSGERVGIVVANAGTEDARAMFEAIHATGARHVRLSAYYREPFALHRTITEAWVADSVGLEVLVDVQPTPWLTPDAPSLDAWTAAWDSIARSLPPSATVSVGNEVNADHWWPWGDDLLDEFWREARRIAHEHGREFAGPHLAGDWPGAVEWLEAFLDRNPRPDILTVHYYGEDPHAWVEALPYRGRVWLAETSAFQGTEADRADHARGVLIGPWERVYLYDWYANPGYRIRGTAVERAVRESIQPERYR